MTYIIPLLYLWALWYAYILVMGLYRAHLAKRLNVFTYVLAAPVLVVGYLMDAIANITFATLIFWDWPREVLVTDRLKRYMQNHDWRGKLAAWICSNLLDVFDPSGDHC